MIGDSRQHLGRSDSTQIRDAGLFKGERVITTPQQARVGVGRRHARC